MTGAAEIFVGRRRELEALRGEFDAARNGRGRIVLLSGEPGIGKTRTATELAEFAEGEGAMLAWGRCHEEAGAPPYWPWSQVLRACAVRLGPGRLVADLGDGVAEIGELVPEIRAALPESQPIPVTRDPAEARFRLFDSITRFLLAQTRRGPLVMVLDDLHWADAPSLRMLEFLAPEIGGERVLVVGTYRETELSRRHRLTDTLGGLVRVATVSRLRLSGLDAEEVRHFVAMTTGAVPAATLVQSLHQHTEGNPLFLREVVRFLHQQGQFDAASPGPAGGVPLRIPEGVREAIGRRLNLLSPACNAVLCVASVIGREFALDVLLRADAERGEDEISAAIDEAQEAHVIEALAPHRFQFTHALIRMTLYEELRAGQRRRLHRAVGEAIEALHRRDPAPVLQDLAHHFQAAALGGDPRAIDYAVRAGHQADAALAFEDAVACFQSALDMLEHDPAATPADCGAMLFNLGESQRKTNDFASAQATLRQAAAIARAEHLSDLLTEIALSYELAEWRRGYSGESTVVDLLQEAYAQLPPGANAMRVRVASSLARALLYTGAVAEARRLMREAVRLARNFADCVLIDAKFSVLNDFPWEPEDSEELRGYAIEAVAASRAAGDLEGTSMALFRAAVHSLELGMLRECEMLAEEMRELDIRLRQPALRYFDIGLRAMLALLRGELNTAEAVILEGVRLHAPGSTHSSDPLSVPIFTLRREQGRLAELRPLVQAFARRDAASAWLPGLALMQVELGDLDAARPLLEELSAGGFAAIPHDGRRTASLVYLAEVCARLGEVRHAQALYDLLLPWAGRNIVLGGGSCCPGATDRFLGLLAATMRRWDDAERHFGVALHLNERIGALAPLAHTQYDFAQMLRSRDLPGDRDRAQALLREAHDSATRLGLVALAQSIGTVREPEAVAAPDNLTPREIEVLRLLAIGRGNADIALVLSISLNTVATHVRNILAKTGCANRTEAAAYAMRHAL